MIIRGIGKRNEDGGQSERGQFGQTGSAGSGDSEIGGAVKFLHPMMKRRHKSRQLGAPIIISHQFFIARSSQMNHLQPRPIH